MSDKWVVDPSHPSGYIVPMSPAEQADYDARQISSAIDAQRDATTAANRASIISGLTTSIDRLTTARAALSGGTIFSTLTSVEKSALDAMLRTNLQLARLALQSFDTPTP